MRWNKEIKHIHKFMRYIFKTDLKQISKLYHSLAVRMLTHWGRVTHICVGKPAIIASDNGLSPDRCQAIIWTNAGKLLIAPLGTDFSEVLTGIQTFSFKKMYLEMSSVKWRPFCLGLSVLMASWHLQECSFHGQCFLGLTWPIASLTCPG